MTSATGPPWQHDETLIIVVKPPSLCDNLQVPDDIQHIHVNCAQHKGCLHL